MPLPEPLRSQVLEGRLAAMEVPAKITGHRSFVTVHPEAGAKTLEESLRLAKEHGAVPVATGFVVRHTEYDEDRLEGWDYDTGRVEHSRVVVATLDQVEVIVLSWGFDPAALLPYHQTDAP